MMHLIDKALYFLLKPTHYFFFFKEYVSGVWLMTHSKKVTHQVVTSMFYLGMIF